VSRATQIWAALDSQFRRWTWSHLCCGRKPVETAYTPAPVLCSLRNRVTGTVAAQWAKTALLQQSMSAAFQVRLLARQVQKCYRWLTLMIFMRRRNKHHCLILIRYKFLVKSREDTSGGPHRRYVPWLPDSHSEQVVISSSICDLI